MHCALRDLLYLALFLDVAHFAACRDDDGGGAHSPAAKRANGDAKPQRALNFRNFVAGELADTLDARSGNDDDVALEEDHRHVQDAHEKRNAVGGGGDGHDEMLSQPDRLVAHAKPTRGSGWMAHVLNALFTLASFGLLRPTVRLTLRLVSLRLQNSKNTRARLVFVENSANKTQ